MATRTDSRISIDWPARPTVENLGQAIGEACGLTVLVKSIPAEHRCREISGLTVLLGSTAHVYVDNTLSPLNRLQTVLHEYAHLLHGDVVPGEVGSHCRTTFGDPVEDRAEKTGLLLMQEMHRRTAVITRKPSKILNFFTGTAN